MLNRLLDLLGGDRARVMEAILQEMQSWPEGTTVQDLAEELDLSEHDVWRALEKLEGERKVRRRTGYFQSRGEGGVGRPADGWFLA